ncbi:MAG: hypothetical protein ACRD0G_00845 [Acidimicrobiales bacterium]
MQIELQAGTRVFGAACSTEGVVVKAPAHPVSLTIGDRPALLDASERLTDEDPGTDAEAAFLGKRYVNDDESVEVLCTRPGNGGFAVDGTPCGVKGAKPLPASD